MEEEEKCFEYKYIMVVAFYIVLLQYVLVISVNSEDVLYLLRIVGAMER